MCHNVKTLTSLSIWGASEEEGGGGEGGGGGSSIIRLGQSWLTSAVSFILIYMSNMEAIC